MITHLFWVELVQVSKIPKDPLQDPTRKFSLTRRFRDSLTSLMTTLNATHPNYVRCLKSNSTRTPCSLDPKLAREQLRYSGVFEAVEIRKKGYPYRLTHAAFCKRYRCIDAKFLKAEQKNEPAAYKKTCAELIAHMKLEKRVKLGVSLVLYRVEEQLILDLHRYVCDESIG